MNDPLNNYYFIPGSLKETIKQFRSELKNAYDLSTEEAVKNQINETFKGLQIMANGLNISGRWAGLGNTPVSLTAPAAPELDEQGVKSIIEVYGE